MLGHERKCALVSSLKGCYARRAPGNACGDPAAFSGQSAPQPEPAVPPLLPSLHEACNTYVLFLFLELYSAALTLCKAA